MLFNFRYILKHKIKHIKEDNIAANTVTSYVNAFPLQ